MRPHGTPAALEARRHRAVALLEQGLKVREVARKIGCSPSSVSRWQAEVQTGNPEALRSKPTPGRPSRLSRKQRTRLLNLLLKGARAHGYSTDLWTLPRVAEVIARTFRVHYHPSHVWKILHEEGWSCQKPERQARERDEESIRQWRAKRWPHIKKRKKDS
jgi:transposase